MPAAHKRSSRDEQWLGKWYKDLKKLISNRVDCQTCKKTTAFAKAMYGCDSWSIEKMPTK